MVEGVFIIIQARINSERLPGKVLMKLGGKPMIEILINRLKQSGFPIILATSQSKENNILCETVKEMGIPYYRGSENNVLERFYFCAKQFGAKFIIRATGDNPLTDGNNIRMQLENLVNIDNRTYFSTSHSNTYPVGTAFEFFAFDLLEEAYHKSSLPGHFEHVTPYMHQNVPGNVNVQIGTLASNYSQYRLTVDNPDDFLLVKTLVEQYKCHKLSLEEIIAILIQNPHLAEINNMHVQRKWNE